MTPINSFKASQQIYEMSCESLLTFVCLYHLGGYGGYGGGTGGFFPGAAQKAAKRGTPSFLLKHLIGWNTLRKQFHILTYQFFFIQASEMLMFVQLSRKKGEMRVCIQHQSLNVRPLECFIPLRALLLGAYLHNNLNSDQIISNVSGGRMSQRKWIAQEQKTNQIFNILLITLIRV